MCSNKVSSCVQESIWYVWGNMRWFKSLKITEVKITEVMKSPGPSKKKKWFLRPNHRSWQRLSLVGLTGKAALPTRTLVAVPEGSWVKTSGPLGSPSLSHLCIPREVLLFLLGLFIWGPEQTSSGTPFRRRRETPYSSTPSPSLFPALTTSGSCWAFCSGLTQQHRADPNLCWPTWHQRPCRRESERRGVSAFFSVSFCLYHYGK